MPAHFIIRLILITKSKQGASYPRKRSESNSPPKSSKSAPALDANASNSSSGIQQAQNAFDQSPDLIIGAQQARFWFMTSRLTPPLRRYRLF